MTPTAPRRVPGLPHWGQPEAPPIGVDFSGEHLNMLQLAPGTAMPARVQAAVSLRYPSDRQTLFAQPRDLRRLVRTALLSRGFIGKRIFSTMPPGAVRILPLTIQVHPGQSESQAITKAAREQLGSTINDAVVDYYHVRGIDAESTERQVLVAVARRVEVVAYLDAVRGAGLDPVALDIGPAAIARLLGALHWDASDQSIVLINFGVEKSFLTVVWGRRLLLDREIDFCETQLTARLTAALGVTAPVALAMLREHGVGGAERAAYSANAAQPDISQTLREILHPEFSQLAEELSRTQVYVASRTRGSLVSQIYLNGSIARYPNLSARIRELVTLPVALLNPLDAFDGSWTPSMPAEGSLALAAGLALRGRQRG